MSAGYRKICLHDLHGYKPLYRQIRAVCDSIWCGASNRDVAGLPGFQGDSLGGIPKGKALGEAFGYFSFLYEK